MPRNHHPAASTLRNRNRITNKTRLKIHQGSLDADAVLIPDEDEEKYRLTNLVAGVDAEDANEHHLQEVLSAAHRNSANNRHTRADSKHSTVAQSVFIPTPDSTGIVDNYEELYPPNKWKDPATYVCTSTTVEEAVTNGLSGGFAYYMDERDQEWLEKNNEEARGEGTSVQGAISVSGTRTSARSAKAKGKEPEPCQPATIAEDEFELVMGLYEKVTHERTEYLHHGLETGMEFPAFVDYQDVFSSPLAPTLFATYILPSWVPEPQVLLRIARAVYPHWKERRIDRGGHRIIPALNGDESDTLNESYICFRRREIKAVRKTRASQASSSDKLVRLQHELSYPLELAKSILIRETLKQENAVQSQGVWEKRFAFADVKRKFPVLNDQADEELLVDKERPVKKHDTSRLKIRPHDDPPPRSEVLLRPKERVAMIRELVETTVARQKDLDHHWEDQVDNPYQALPVPYASRLFKYIPPLNAPCWPSSHSDTSDGNSTSPPLLATRVARAVRMRYGRGGRIHLDRRNSTPPSLAVTRLPRSSLFDVDEPMDVEDPEDSERRRLLEQRWKFDSDDAPPVGPDGSEEQDRTMIDDYDTMHLRHTMTLFSEIDHAHLLTDPTLIIPNAEGRPQMFLPYRLGMLQQPMIRRDAQGVPRPFQPTMNGLVPIHSPSSMNGAHGHQIKKMPPPNTGVQMRISSNGGMRPPMAPVSNLQSNGGSSSPTLHQMSPSQTLPVPITQHSLSTNGINGVSRAAINLPQVDVNVHKSPDIISPPAIPNGIAVVSLPQSDIKSGNVEVTVNGGSLHAKPQNSASPQPQLQQHLGTSIPTNGYHLTHSVSAYSHSQSPPQLNNISNGGGGLSQQQMRDLKSAFANVNTPEFTAMQNASRSSYMHLSPNGSNVNGIQLLPGMNIGNLKLSPGAAAARQMQWGTMPTPGSPIMQMQQIPMPRPGSVVNGNHLMDGQLAVNGGKPLPSPNLGTAGLPVRTPSANGIRLGMRSGMVVNGQPHSMSPPLMRHSPSPLPNISQSQSQSQSPTRMPMTPNMAIVGSPPSLQHQQPPQTQSIGSTLNGY